MSMRIKRKNDIRAFIKKNRHNLYGENLVIMTTGDVHIGSGDVTPGPYTHGVYDLHALFGREDSFTGRIDIAITKFFERIEGDYITHQNVRNCYDHVMLGWDIGRLTDKEKSIIDHMEKNKREPKEIRKDYINRIYGDLR
jgi:hypothetical protein